MPKPTHSHAHLIKWYSLRECCFYRSSQVEKKKIAARPKKPRSPYYKVYPRPRSARSRYAVFTAPPILGDRRRRARSDADKCDPYYKVLGVAITPPQPLPSRGGALLSFRLRYVTTGKGRKHPPKTSPLPLKSCEKCGRIVLNLFSERKKS